FINHFRILTAFNTGGRPCVVRKREVLTCSRSGHDPSGSMTAALEALRVSQSPHNVRPSAHAAGNDSPPPPAAPNRTLTRYESFVTEVSLLRGVVVVTVHRNGTHCEGLHFFTQRTQHRIHHCPTILSSVILGPVHRLDVIVEMLSPFNQIRQVPVRQVDEVAL